MREALHLHVARANLYGAERLCWIRNIQEMRTRLIYPRPEPKRLVPLPRGLVRPCGQQKDNP